MNYLTLNIIQYIFLKNIIDALVNKFIIIQHYDILNL